MPILVKPTAKMQPVRIAEDIIPCRFSKNPHTFFPTGNCLHVTLFNFNSVGYVYHNRVDPVWLKNTVTEIVNAPVFEAGLQSLVPRCRRPFKNVEI